MSLPSLKVAVFFISLCFDMVSFRGQKKPGLLPDCSPLGFNLKFPTSIPPLFICEQPPPLPPGGELMAGFHCIYAGAPKENIVQNHLNKSWLNVFWYLNGRYRHIFIP